MYCREVCMISMDNKYQQHGKIGRPSHVIQIDECKKGRCEYHRGHVVVGNWILGMIDVETKVQMTICPNKRRDSNTLYDLIVEHVELTSTIHTDAWRGYYGVLAGGFAVHLSVNHSESFMGPVTNCHTNNIESCWRALSHWLSRGGIRRDDTDVYICKQL